MRLEYNRRIEKERETQAFRSREFEAGDSRRWLLVRKFFESILTWVSNVNRVHAVQISMEVQAAAYLAVIHQHVAHLCTL